MLRHNILLIFRRFKRDKTGFLINLAGSSTGLSCPLLIYLRVNDEMNFDKFHSRDRQLYQACEFTKLVYASALIALPISCLMTRYWLNRFAFRIDLQVWFFIGAGLIALFIAWITIGIQTVKAARSNPASNLRTE